jgi:hypothetical protein
VERQKEVAEIIKDKIDSADESALRRRDVPKIKKSAIDFAP